MVWTDTVLPFKRFTRNELSYMDKPEMDALSLLPIAARNKGCVIMHFCCFYIILALA